MSEIEQKLEQFLKKNKISSQEASAAIRNIITNESASEIEKRMNIHAPYIGKCFTRESVNRMFPSFLEYIKVISVRSTNQYRVECLVFPQHPTYWFRYNSSKIGHPGDYYLGTFEFEAIRTESIMISDIQTYRSVPVSIYNQALRNFTEELIKTEWICDHCRAGGKMPSEKDWKTTQSDV